MLDQLTPETRPAVVVRRARDDGNLDQADRASLLADEAVVDREGATADQLD